MPVEDNHPRSDRSSFAPGKVRNLHIQFILSPGLPLSGLAPGGAIPRP